MDTCIFEDVSLKGALIDPFIEAVVIWRDRRSSPELSRLNLTDVSLVTGLAKG